MTSTASWVFEFGPLLGGVLTLIVFGALLLKPLRVAVLVAWAVISATFATISMAPEIAASSAADWFWRLIAYHSPFSAPRPASPTKAGIRRATITATNPRRSRGSRASAPRSRPPGLIVIA